MTRMKESGIDWIGQIPEEWEVTRIKNIVSIERGASPRPIDKFISDDDTGVNWIRIGDTYKGNKYITSTRLKITNRGKQFSRYIHPGTLILSNSMSFGEPYISSIYGCIHDGWLSLTPYSNISKEYLYWLLLSDVCTSQFNLVSIGAVVENLSVDKVGNTLVSMPYSLSEQQKIADFLDKKTAQLDKVKSLLEEQIQKLKDYRASLIYETVTKGLDKTVPMKDSGIDWIGQVPEGWGVKRLKDYVDFQTGTTPPQSIGVNQERKGVRWFKPGDFSDESVDLTSAENFITSEIVKQQKLSVYPEKTILVVGIASIGKVGYSENFSYSNQQITALKVTGQIFPKYLAYLMFSSGQYIRETALYTIVPIINNQYLSSLKIVLPNRVVQETIVEYLDKKIGQINKMIVIKNKQIENIDKQRQTLIYDYVTGKRRV